MREKGRGRGRERITANSERVLYLYIPAICNAGQLESLCLAYSSAVDRECRSRVNVPFRIAGPAGHSALEKKFLEKAHELGMLELKGHR